MPVSLVHQFLERHAHQRPEATLVVDGDTETTYGTVEAQANQIARALLAEGVARGDRIALVAVNSREYITSYYGILKSGAIAVSLNAAADWRTHCELLELSEARGLICGRRLGRRATGLTQLPRLDFVIGHAADWTSRLDDVGACRLLDRNDLLSAMEARPPEIPLRENDRAAIIYTSGSTGRPKGVTLTHRNLVANTQSIVQYLDLTADDRVFVVLPFHYVYGKSLLNTHVTAGGSVVIENQFMFPQKALDNLEKTDATGLSGVPSTFAILLNRSNLADRKLASLRYVTQAGGAMAPELQRRLVDALPGKRVVIMYGATEASARLSYLDPDELPTKLGSIGKAIPGVDLRVLRDDGTEADEDEVGELVARGPNIMEGYWRDPVETAAVLDEWGYRTGDLGRRDAEGFLYVVGRKREMIKSGAHRISPKEIEEALVEHPAIHEAAVIGVPDDILGESITAFVSAREKAQPGVNELLTWCKRRLPAYKVPAALRVMPELRRNAAGKIDKRFLARQVSDSAGH